MQLLQNIAQGVTGEAGLLKIGYIAALAAVAFASPAHACRLYAPLELSDVRYAEIVVVGRIADYRIVRDEKKRAELIARLRPDDPWRKAVEGGAGILSDYARFNVVVDEVLKGRAPGTISVAWDNSTFNEPATMPAGRFLVALRDPTAKAPPLRGPSAYIAANPAPSLPTVLQAQCARPFLFAVSSREAADVRRLLTSK